nr:LINE-1 retrotransposable element ORF2 protein [Tanacetum cinerariifolium]
MFTILKPICIGNLENSHHGMVIHLNHITQEWQRSQQAATRNKGKAIVNSPPAIYDQEPSMVAEDDEMIVNVAGARETVGTTVVQKSRIQCYNCKEYGHVARECQKPKRAKDATYHKKKMLLCNQEEVGFQLNAEQVDWKDDTDDEPDDDDDLANERDLLASLIEKLNCEIDDSKNHNKFLETSNKVLVDKLQGQIEKHAINLKLDLHQCKEKIKNDKSFKENQSKEFCKEREQYFEIQDLKAQLQDKGITISELKKIIEKLKGKYVETKFEKSSVIRQPNAFKSQRPSILGKPTIFSDSLEKKDCSKSKSVTKNNVSTDFSKPVTAQILPPNKKSTLKNTNVLAPGMYKLHTGPIQNKTTQLPHDFRKTNKRVSFSTGVIPFTSVSRPQLKSNRIEDRVMLNNSQGKKQEIEDHRRNVKFSKNKTSVTACNDSLNAKTSNVNFVCVTCGKCVLNDKHDMCVLYSLNGVNSRTKMPIAMHVSTREPKRIVNQSVATPLRRTVALESTNQKPRHTTRKLYEHVSDACIFVGYSTQSRAYRVFNKRTRVIVETIHVYFDELPQMASDHVSSDPVPQCQRTALEHDSLSPGPQLAKVKDKAYEDLYKKLDSKDGVNDIYKIAKARERRRMDLGNVKYIKDEGGRTIVREKDIKTRWGEYFSSLFNKTPSEESRLERSEEVGRSSPPTHFDCYYSRIDHGEVRAALQKMGRNKAVGPDQIPIEAWRTDVIRRHLWQFVKVNMNGFNYHSCSLVKYPIFTISDDVAKRAENVKELDRRFSVIDDVVRCFLMSRNYERTVLSKTCCGNCFSPKEQKNFSGA